MRFFVVVAVLSIVRRNTWVPLALDEFRVTVKKKTCLVYYSFIKLFIFINYINFPILSHF